MKLAFTVDVEEEGLFSGQYSSGGNTKNVDRLSRLEFITTAHGVPLTLFTSHAVVQNHRSMAHVMRLRDTLGAEIGAHLHHWSTPPLAPAEHAPPLPCDRLGSGILRQKLETLTSGIRKAAGRAPASFRMGRWDACPGILNMLPEFDYLVDSSMVPMRHAPPSHSSYSAGHGPFVLQTPSGPLTEVPLTVLPAIAGLDRFIHSTARALPPAWSNRLLTSSRKWAACGPQPVWFPLPSMKLSARLLARSKEAVMVMFLHSSELMPGGHPAIRTEMDANALIDKIDTFLTWLGRSCDLQGATVSELQLPPSHAK